MEGAGWTGGWGPGLTWQDGPRYPGGQVHCSTSSAGSWPVSSGTATSMLMPETLGVARPTVNERARWAWHPWSPTHHHLIIILPAALL